MVKLPTIGRPCSDKTYLAVDMNPASTGRPLLSRGPQESETFSIQTSRFHYSSQKKGLLPYRGNLKNLCSVEFFVRPLKVQCNLVLARSMSILQIVLVGAC